MSNGSNGKGDRRRPSQISEAEFTERWAMAFGKIQDDDSNIDFRPPDKEEWHETPCNICKVPFKALHFYADGDLIWINATCPKCMDSFQARRLKGKK